MPPANPPQDPPRSPAPQASAQASEAVRAPAAGPGVTRADARAQGRPVLAQGPNSLSICLGLVSAAVIITALYFGRDILMPLALAALLGFMLDPAVNRLKRWGLPRTVSVVAVMLVTVGALIFAGFLLGQQVRTLSEQLPTYQTSIRDKLTQIRQSMRGPGMFDGALETFKSVQREVDRPVTGATGNGAGQDAARAPAKVQVVEPPMSPLDQALTGFSLAGGPLAMAGIVFVFMFLVLFDRADLRDRLLRLMGGNLHRGTDALDEASERIGKYLRMQVIVNVSYGVPMALGLWAIGVPGAILWGALAALMRFVPFIGPMISAVFPLALAFAVDPGWNMVLWTLALIAVLELLSNNIVEPLLYGPSTGLSALSLIAAATFWTALWGPIGLVMSTPLTVCLLVIGRYIPQLQFLEVLLGTQPALDPPTRFYQRLLAGDDDETLTLAIESVEENSLVEFYDEVGIPVLQMASADHAHNATAEHRLRVLDGMESVIEELCDNGDPDESNRSSHPRVLCLGGKWEIDTLSAMMLSHALRRGGIAASHSPGHDYHGRAIARLPLENVQVVCLCYFSRDPQTAIRQAARRLRRHWPHLRIVAVLWNAPSELLAQDDPAQLVGTDAVATRIAEAAPRAEQLLDHRSTIDYVPAPRLDDESERLAAVLASRLLDPQWRGELDAASQRAADIFDAPFATISVITADDEVICGRNATQRSEHASPEPGDNLASPARIARAISLSAHLVAQGETLIVPDLHRDPRFADNPQVLANDWRMFAAAALRDEKGQILGALSLYDTQVRHITEREAALLEAMSRDVLAGLQGRGKEAASRALPDNEAPSGGQPLAGGGATVGQVVP